MEIRLQTGRNIVQVAQAVQLEASGNVSGRVDLTVGSLSSGAAEVVLVVLSQADANAIKTQFPMGERADATLLSTSSLLVADMAGNAVEAVVGNQAIQSMVVVGDLIAPRLVAFDVDMTDNVLTLEFSETVNSSSLAVTAVELHSQGLYGSNGLRYQLSGGAVSVANQPVVRINLTRGDSNAIKALNYLATSANNTFVVVADGGVQDMAGNGLVSGVAVNSSLLAVRMFRADSVRPQLVNFTVNMSSGQVDLTFSKTVNPGTLNSSGLVLVLNRLGQSAVRLSQVSASNTAASPVLSFVIGLEDMNTIKAQDGLFTSTGTAFVAVDATLVADMSSNAVEAVGVGAALQASGFVADGCGQSWAASSWTWTWACLCCPFLRRCG